MKTFERQFWMQVFMAVIARSSAAIAAEEANRALESFRKASTSPQQLALLRDADIVSEEACGEVCKTDPCLRCRLDAAIARAAEDGS